MHYPPILVAMLAALSAGLSLPAFAESGSIIEQARTARFENAPENALDLLGDWLDAYPEDSDAWLEAGYAQIALGDLDAARLSFEQVLKISPGYTDAEVGLARIDYFNGDLMSASDRLDRMVDTGDTRELRKQIKTAQAAVEVTSARAEIFVERSSLSGGLPDWKTVAASLSDRIAPNISLNGTVEHTQRFEREDLYTQVQVDWGSGDRWASYAGVGGTVNADFRPRAILYGGSQFGLIQAKAGRAALDGTISASVAEYTSGQVTTLSPGFIARFSGDTARFGGRLIALSDETGELRYGQAYEAGLDVLRGLGLRLSWSDAPETSEGRTFDVESISLSAKFEITSQVTAVIGASSEQRSAYDRDVLSFSLRRAFR
ncbi:MAG: YaiO family outer membrane beta-barrel protein [Hyphomonas sp.]